MRKTKIIETPVETKIDLDKEVSNLAKKKSNRVEHPAHYNMLPFEVIEVSQYFNFTLGNVLKYVMRSGYKEEEGLTKLEKQIEDLEKAKWYLEFEINRLSKLKEQEECVG